MVQKYDAAGNKPSWHRGLGGEWWVDWLCLSRLLTKCPGLKKGVSHIRPLRNPQMNMLCCKSATGGTLGAILHIYTIPECVLCKAASMSLNLLLQCRHGIRY